MSYYDKYIKYKTKYQELKKWGIGGNDDNNSIDTQKNYTLLPINIEETYTITYPNPLKYPLITLKSNIQIKIENSKTSYMYSITATFIDYKIKFNITIEFKGDNIIITFSIIKNNNDIFNIINDSIKNTTFNNNIITESINSTSIQPIKSKTYDGKDILTIYCSYIFKSLKEDTDLEFTDDNLYDYFYKFGKPDNTLTRLINSNGQEYYATVKAEEDIIIAQRAKLIITKKETITTTQPGKFYGKQEVTTEKKITKIKYLKKIIDIIKNIKVYKTINKDEDEYLILFPSPESVNAIQIQTAESTA